MRGHLGWGWLGAVVAVAAGLVAHDATGGHPSDLLLDARSLGGLPSHFGVLATLGTVAWGAAAATFLAGGLALRDADPPRSRFLVVSAIGLALLLADDVARFHDHLAPVELGVSERLAELALAAGILAVALRHRHEVLRHDAALLMIAVGGVLLSAVVDGLELGSSGTEEFPKLVGLGTLVVFAVREVVRLRARIVGSEPPGR